jgi:hypothetical protein
MENVDKTGSLPHVRFIIRLNVIAIGVPWNWTK